MEYIQMQKRKHRRHSNQESSKVHKTSRTPSGYESDTEDRHEVLRRRKRRRLNTHVTERFKDPSPVSRKRKLASDEVHERHERRIKSRRHFSRFEREGAPSPESSDSDPDQDEQEKFTIYKYFKRDLESRLSSSSDSSASESETSSESDDSFSSSGTESDSDHRGLEEETDTRKRTVKCPSSCPCKTGHIRVKMKKLHREEGFKVLEPLYKKVLRKRLLGNMNFLFYTCCENECSKRWVRKRKVREIRPNDYGPGGLKKPRID